MRAYTVLFYFCHKYLAPNQSCIHNDPAISLPWVICQLKQQFLFPNPFKHSGGFDEHFDCRLDKNYLDEQRHIFLNESLISVMNRIVTCYSKS